MGILGAPSGARTGSSHSPLGGPTAGNRLLPNRDSGGRGASGRKGSSPLLSGQEGGGWKKLSGVGGSRSTCVAAPVSGGAGGAMQVVSGGAGRGYAGGVRWCRRGYAGGVR